MYLTFKTIVESKLRHGQLHVEKFMLKFQKHKLKAYVFVSLNGDYDSHVLLMLRKFLSASSWSSLNFEKSAQHCNPMHY